jgi:hypothetical protein
MSLFGNEALKSVDSNFDMDSIVESFLFDDLQRMGSDQIKQFLESDQCIALQERQVLKKPTVMRLSKADDEKRRIKLICYQLAREAKDPNWDKCVKYRALWKKHRAIIFDKYKNRATRLAQISQREYIKRTRGEQATEEQKKAEQAK